jgi:5,10-methylenetetrahydromethanopterin reductase
MGDSSRLGVYVLPGPAMDATVAVTETESAERLGLGSAWESEIQSAVKDAGAILGYMGHATSRIRIGTSITHFTIRNPFVLASWGATMQMLTGGRFEFGFGRSSKGLFYKTGTRPPTVAAMEDYASILRRLWAGEAVQYEGPAGSFPQVSLGEMPEGVQPPPLLIAAVGPRTLDLAGRVFDGVFLHPFLTTEAVARSAKTVRDAAEKAGRDPGAVQVYHQLVLAPDMADEQVDEVVGARLAAYLSIPGVENMIPDANGWDVAELEPFRKQVAESLAANQRAGSPLKGRAVLVEPGRLIPKHWTEATSGSGSPAECAKALDRYFEAGADQIIIHGVTADHLDATIAAFTAN